MRQVLLLLFLVLSTLAHEAQGRHLKKGHLSATNHKLQEKALGEVTLCKDGHCSSSSGRHRKVITLTTSTSSSTPTTPIMNVKNEGNKADPTLKGQSSTSKTQGGKEENFLVNREKHYPDVLDLAGMDYSAPMRKTPIHN